MKRKKGFYSISVVAKMFSVHQQTIRLYEKEGLINPKRSSGNTRLFSEEDVDKLEEVIYLTHKLGVNLAGVEVIMGLQKKVSKLQSEINSLFVKTQEDLKNEEDDYKQAVRKQAKRLVRIKEETQESILEPIDSDSKKNKAKPVDVEIVDDWEVDYED
ncbi:MerR family transcriptional regulator [Candidatus Babeliales bacterium]|nr:MerR family transcriptional regulator [Candidatus Babeliales bacterium]